MADGRARGHTWGMGELPSSSLISLDIFGSHRGQFLKYLINTTYLGPFLLSIHPLFVNYI
jgi:hypothetical protein